MKHRPYGIAAAFLFVACGGGDGEEPIVLTEGAIPPPVSVVDQTPGTPETLFPSGDEVFRNRIAVDVPVAEADADNCHEPDTLSLEFRWRGPRGGFIHRWGDEPVEPDPRTVFLQQLRGPTHYEICVSADPARPCTGTDAEEIYKPVPRGSSFIAELPGEKFYLREFTWQMKACNRQLCSAWSPPVRSSWGFAGPVPLNTEVVELGQADGSTRRELRFRYCPVYKTPSLPAHHQAEFLCFAKRNSTGTGTLASDPNGDCTMLLLGDENGQLNGAIRADLETRVRIEEVDAGSTSIDESEWPAAFGDTVLWSVGACFKDQTVVGRETCGFSVERYRSVSAPVWLSPP